MRTRIIHFAFIAGAALFIAPAAHAAQFVLTQQHSQAQVYAACDSVGGVRLKGENGGYGCYNPDNGNMVACSDGGTCTGYTPGRIAPRRLDVTFLGPGTRLEVSPPEPQPRGGPFGAVAAPTRVRPAVTRSQ